MAALATHTTTLRLSPLVANAGLWRPDLLVREILTADQISGGRVEIAVGAGVSPGGPAKPLTHLRDTVLALRASLREAANPPGWVSTPPILVARSGDNLLHTAGELADIVGIAVPFPYPVNLPPGHIPLLSRFGLSYFAIIGVTPAEFAPVIDALRKGA